MLIKRYIGREVCTLSFSYQSCFSFQHIVESGFIHDFCSTGASDLVYRKSLAFRLVEVE